MGKLKILFAIAAIIGAIFIISNFEKIFPNSDSMIEKEIAKCNGNERFSCILQIAIEKKDGLFCDKTGELKDECLGNVEMAKNPDICQNITIEEQMDVCSIRFPEKFAKINCNSFDDNDLKEYCELLKAG